MICCHKYMALLFSSETAPIDGAPYKCKNDMGALSLLNADTVEERPPSSLFTGTQCSQSKEMDKRAYDTLSSSIRQCEHSLTLAVCYCSLPKAAL